MDCISELIFLLDCSIRDDAALTIQAGNIIKTGYKNEIDEMRNIQENGYEWILQYQKTIGETTKLSSAKIKFTQNLGYFIEVPKSHIGNIPDFFILKQTLVQASRYTTKELQEFEEKLLHAEEIRVRLEYDTFMEIRDTVLGYFNDLYTISRKIEYIDFITNGAFIAQKRNYCPVHFHKKNSLFLEGGKHPVVGLVQKDFIKNDLFLDEKERIHVITGPNMGGKSTFLRQNALLILMAHMGYYIPAQKAEMGVIDKIFSRVGAGDNIFLGQSTFMVEMQEVSYIVRNATSKSFIIVDEVGRGTSTHDGMSLAWAILEYIHSNLHSKLLFATHYHEIIEQTQKLGAVKNFSVAVGENDENIVFLRKIIPGAIKKSYGIEVAKLAGIPEEILKTAYETLKKFETQATSHIQLTLGIPHENNFISNNEIIKYNKIKEIEEKIKKININALTPLQAITLLSQFQEEVKNMK